MSPKLLTVDDLADHLGVPKNTLYRWRTTGYGPAGKRIGKHVRRAIVNYKDYDGVTRPVEKVGPSKAKASNALAFPVTARSQQTARPASLLRPRCPIWTSPTGPHGPNRTTEERGTAT